jgi:hypothetical protein
MATKQTAAQATRESVDAGVRDGRGSAEDAPPVTVTKSMRNTLLPLADKFREICEENGGEHGNRKLEAPEVLLALLLAFFNPSLRTLRDMDLVSQRSEGLDWLGKRLPKTTLSDSLACLDPELLRPLIADLMARMPAVDHRHAELMQLTKKVIAVDGSFFNLAADVAWAISQRPRGKKSAKVARLNLHLDCASGVPEGVSVSGSGESESGVLRKNLTPGEIHVCDRGFYSHALIAEAVKKEADFVIRVRGNAQFTAEEKRVLETDGDSFGVVSDRIGRLAEWKGDDESPLLREVVVEVENREGGTTRIRLLTTLLDLPARMIAMIYQRRWQVELFFRWLKVTANFRHLLSHSKRGVQWQFYAGIMAILAMVARTGRKPGKFTLKAVIWSMQGLGDLEGLLEGAKRMEDQMARDSLLRKQRTAKRKAEAEAKDAAAKTTKA